MAKLVPHPDCAPGSITAVSAELVPTADGCRASFVARGDVARIMVPQARAPGRFDNLWQTTCFEIFWQGQASKSTAAYREFNLSPSSRWAAYDFDDVRVGMRHAPAEVAITTQASAGELRIEAKIAADLPLPAAVALNAIIADEDGVNRYWALAFPPGRADFHSHACRALAVPARP